MKKFFTLLCVALCATSLFANIVTGICGENLQWSYDTDTHALTITGSGNMWDYHWEYDDTPWEQVAGEIISVSLPDGLTSIGRSAFYSCSSLASITIPNSVTSIGESAFRTCSSLTSITIPNSVTSIGNYAFYECTSLASITIPNSVTSIEDWAFNGCSSLASLTIPNSVTSIGNYAFRVCSSLTSITIPNSVTSIGDYAFQGCSSLTPITIPNSVTSIRYAAFQGCSSLTSITIPNSVTSIGNRAFEGCFSLTSITIPNSVTSIEDWAFADCYNLAKVVAPSVFFDIIPEDPFGEFPKNLQYIEVTSGELTDDAWLFINRSYKTLNVLNLSATSNTTLADEALKGCYMLDSLYLPENLVELPYMSVADCKHLKSINIPATVEVIGEGAFENCRLLSEVNFAENGALTEISNWAFYNCHELKNIVIPEGVTNIGYAAFYGCTYLKELTLPASMQSVADNGFALCEKLAKMNVNAVVPPVVEARTFENVDRMIPVVVPTESVSAYKAAPIWQEFNIVGKNNVPSAVDNVDASNRSTKKLLYDGNLVIIRDGVEYNVMGQEL